MVMCVLVSVHRDIILCTAAKDPFDVGICTFFILMSVVWLSKQTKIILISYKEGQRAKFRRFGLNQPSLVHFYVKIHLCNHPKS